MNANLIHWIAPPANVKTALADRILQSRVIPNPSSVTSASDDGGGSNSPYFSTLSTASIEIFQVHPHASSPILAYVDFGSTDEHSKTHTADLDPHITSNTLSSFKDSPSSRDPHRQRIVVQNYRTRCTIRIISMIDIARDILHSNNRLISYTIKDIVDTCQKIGNIVSISFLDANSSYITGAMMDTCTVAAQVNPRYPMASHLFNDKLETNINEWVCEKVPPCLVIHFKSRILVYSIACDTVSPTLSFSSSIRAHIGVKTLHNSKPSSSSTISILTPNLIAIGCSDGVIRFYNIVTQKVVVAILGPNGRSDAIVRLVSTNPLNGLDVSHRLKSLQRDSSIFKDSDTRSYVEDPYWNEHEQGSSKSFAYAKSRFVSVCQSGDAFVWETTVKVNTNDGSIEKLKIRPPLCKLDWSENHNVSSSSTSILSSSSNPFPVLPEKSRITYDPERDWILWTTICETFVGSKHYVFMWDLSPSSLSKILTGTDKEKQTVPVLKRSLTLVIPSNISTDPIPTEAHVIPGFSPSSFSSLSLASFMSTSSGDMLLAASSSVLQDDSSDSQQKLVAYYQFSLASSLRSTDERVSKSICEEKIKVFSIHAGPSGDMVILSTNAGVAVLRVEDESILRSGSRHVCVSVDNFGCHIGPGNGVIYIEESSVYHGDLSHITPNPTDWITARDPILLYKSPLPLHKPVEFQIRPSRVPPRLLPSPSGHYMCLFWHAESRYEILHLSSLLAPVKAMKKRKEAEYSPAVANGVDVLSFAWVGDGDRFALLHPPEMSKVEVDYNMTVPSKERKKISSRRITNADEDGADSIFDPSKFLPSVELKYLVAVDETAIEITGGVGAATAVTLGFMPLRGRYIPSRLFGGPVLCVASLMHHRDSGHTDGNAFFYNTRDTTVDAKASSFTSVGPSLPFPDFVEWDQEGKLCAIAVGRRIFVYKSEHDTFTHLGSTSIGNLGEPDERIQSISFIYGSLLCATQTTIRILFLGYVGDKKSTFEIDSYLLASNHRPSVYLSPNIDPVAVPLIVKSPSVLTFFNGSLLLSSGLGLQAVPLNQPLVRIGILMAWGDTGKAERWIKRIDLKFHEELAHFLERRGAAELAVQLPGISTATVIDLCLKNSLGLFLEKFVRENGTKKIRDVDNGRGLNGSQLTAVVSVGSYLLGMGKTELVRYMATECLTFGDERARMDAIALASLLVIVQPADGQRLVKRAFGMKISVDDLMEGSHWLLGDAVKEFILNFMRDR